MNSDVKHTDQFIAGLNHMTFSVSDLERSIAFYQQVFGAILLLRTGSIAHFNLAGLWLVLNEEPDILRTDTRRSYTHVAFTVAESDINALIERLRAQGVEAVPGRARDAREGVSLYIRDPDGHMFEFHTGDRESRLGFHRETIRNEVTAGGDAPI